MTYLQRAQTVVSVLNNANNADVAKRKLVSMSREWGMPVANMKDFVAAIEWTIRHGKKTGITVTNK